jgi:hypothetical protein
MNGIMDNPMKVIGKMEKNKDMEYGDRQMEIVMKDNGQTEDKMEKGHINIK